MPHWRWVLKLVPVVLLVAVGLFVFTACPEEEEGVETPTPMEGTPTLAPQPTWPATAQELQTEVTAPVDGVIEVVKNDEMYVKNNLKVPLGQPVTIKFINEGQAIHNARIAGVDGQWNTEDDFPTDLENVKPGEVGEIVFTPQVPGTYVFRCDFHPTTHWGQIVVE